MPFSASCPANIKNRTDTRTIQSVKRHEFMRVDVGIALDG